MSLQRRHLVSLCLFAFALSACGAPAATPAAATATATPPATPTAAPTLPPPSPTPDGGALDPAEPALPPTDFVGVLRDRVAAGAFTYEEGLLAALRAFAGEGSYHEAFGDAEIHADEANGVIALAQDYLAHGADPAVKAEVQRLVDRLIPSAERLLPYAIPQPTPSGVGKVPGQARRGLQADEDCDDLWSDGFPPDQDLVCIQYTEATLAAGVGRVFYPATWWPSDPKLQDVLAATEAMVRSANVLAQFGRTGSVDLIFVLVDYQNEADDRRLLAAVPGLDGDVCQVLIFPRATAFAELVGLEVFRQVVAHEMFHCVQYWNFEGVDSYTGNKWWIEGSAEYFGNVVYPSTNMEWARISDFESRSAREPLNALSYENTVFFQHLANEIGDQAVIGLLKSMPDSDDPANSLAVLAAYPDVQAIFHRFARDAMDQTIIDTGGGYLPTQGAAAEAKTKLIAAPARFILSARPFVVPRHRLRFAAERTYQLVSRPSGADGRDAARLEEVPQAWDAYPTTVDAECGDVQYLFILTTTELGGQREVEVEVKANEKDAVECEEEDTPTFAGETACDHPYMPLRPGASWTYASTDGSQYTYSVTSVSGDTGNATATMTVAGPETGIEYVWKCSAGEGVLRYMTVQNSAGLAPVTASLAQASGALLPPIGYLTPGAEWDSVVVLNTATSDPAGGSTTGGMTLEDHYTVTGVESVKIGDWSFIGLKVARAGRSTLWFMIGDQSSNPITRNKSETLVYARDVGLVQSGTGKLVSFHIP